MSARSSDTRPAAPRTPATRSAATRPTDIRPPDTPAAAPTVEVTAELVESLVALGGYVHPLFTSARPGAPTPLPGQAVLLLMGGLAEQSGLLDDAIAMVEITGVRFTAMVVAGMSLALDIDALDARVTSTGKVIRNYRWTARTPDGAQVAVADIVMLLSAPEGN